jgi:hypothetical protein
VRCSVERPPVLLASACVERGRVRLADVVESLADRVRHQLVVAVELFGFVRVGVRPGGVGLSRLGEQVRLALEQVELPIDELVEAAAPEDHASSR